MSKEMESNYVIADKKDRDRLLAAIKDEDVKEVVKVTAHILAKDDEACMEIAEAYLAADKENENGTT